MGYRNANLAEAKNYDNSLNIVYQMINEMDTKEAAFTRQWIQLREIEGSRAKREN